MIYGNTSMRVEQLRDRRVRKRFGKTLDDGLIFRRTDATQASLSRFRPTLLVHRRSTATREAGASAFGAKFRPTVIFRAMKADERKTSARLASDCHDPRFVSCGGEWVRR